GVDLFLPAERDRAGQARDADARPLKLPANLVRISEEDVAGRQQGLVEEAANLDAVIAVLLGAGEDGVEIPGRTTDGAEGEFHEIAAPENSAKLRPAELAVKLRRWWNRPRAG